MHVSKTYTATEIAKELGFRSATALQSGSSGEAYPVQAEQKPGCSTATMPTVAIPRSKQEVLDNGKVIYHRRWTQLGREFLLNLYSGGGDSMTDQLLTIKQAAARLNISTDTMRRLVWANEISYIDVNQGWQADSSPVHRGSHRGVFKGARS